MKTAIKSMTLPPSLAPPAADAPTVVPAESDLTPDVPDLIFPPADRERLAERMKLRMQELGLNPHQVASRSELSFGPVYNLLRAREQNPKFRTLKQVSITLKCSIAWLIGGNDILAHLGTIPIIAIAEADVYRAKLTPIASGITQMDGVAGRASIQDVRPTNPMFHNTKRFAIKVRDDQLAGLSPPVTRGMVALVIEISDFDLESGRVYLLARPNNDGLCEYRFWRAAVYQDRVEFAPVSPDQDRNDQARFTVPRDILSRKDYAINVLGLFYAAVHQYL